MYYPAWFPLKNILPPRLAARIGAVLPITLVLIIAALLRFNHMSQPYIDAFSWRQSSTAMIAYNFYHTSWNIFYPEVSWDGPGPSYQGREFQTVSYIAALLYLVVGQHDWVGRNVAIFFGLWGIFALYQLIRRVWDEERAIVGAAVMALLPGSIFIERSFLPDPAMVALITTSFWMYVAYLQTNQRRYLWLAGIIGAWGLLTKIPGLIIGLPLLYTTFTILYQQGRLQLKRLATLGAVAVLTLIPVVAYYLWARHVALSYPPYHFAGGGNWLWNYGLQAWLRENYFWADLIEHFNGWLWTTPMIVLVGLGLLFGPITLSHNKKFTWSQPLVDSSERAPWLFHWWFFAGIIYYLLGAKELIGNPWNFHIVNPAAAALAGHAIVSVVSFKRQKIWSPSSFLLTVCLMGTIFVFGQNGLEWMYKPYADDSYKLGLALRQITRPDELVVTLADSFGDPVAIYYSQRRGWIFPPARPGLDWGKLPNDDNVAIQLFEELRTSGAGWLGIVNERKKDFWTDHPQLVEYVNRNCDYQAETSEYIICRIIRPAEVIKPIVPESQPTESAVDGPLVTQEIRYQLSEAGEVFIVWGINGWSVIPQAQWPTGTWLKNAVMYTPMNQEGNAFVARLLVPSGATIDYVFQITKRRDGSTTEVWDANGDPKQDYSTIAGQEIAVEIQAPSAILKQLRTDDLDTGRSGISLGLLMGGSLVLALFAAGIWFLRSQASPWRHTRKRSSVPMGTQTEDPSNIGTPSTHRRLLLNGALLLLLVLVIVLVTFVYVSNEQTFYFWDYAAYHDMSLAKAVYFRELPLSSPGQIFESLREIRNSTARDYNDLHTLLIIPFLLAFGDSRLVYILGLALVYLLPFTLIIGAIATKLVPAYSRTLVFWTTALLALFVPAIWLPTLRGYPDTGAAALIALAILVYVHDLQLKRWWQIGLIGLCIASAVLFRRHFVYAGISLFIVISLQTAAAIGFQMWQRPPRAWFELIKGGMRIGLMAVSTLIVLVILGWPFVERVLNTDFGQLYASYEVSLARNLNYYSAFYGFIALTLAGLGFAVGIRKGVLARAVAIFLILYLVISMGQWVLTVKQLGIHYSLHFTLAIVLGLAAFGWTVSLILKNKIRTVVLSAGVVYLVINALIGLAPVNLLAGMPLVQKLGISEFFSANNPPLQREDYHEVARLIDYLRSLKSDNEAIYVAASSGLLSADHLWHAERALHEHVISFTSSEFWQNKDLNIFQWVPFADSRDAYPLEKLLQSNFVVIAAPFQYHLRPEEQDVIKVVVDTFTENWEFAQDFVPLSEEFFLTNDVDVTVYQRTRPTSLGVALRYLNQIRHYIGPRPGGQPGWINLSGIADSYVTKTGDNSYEITMDLKAAEVYFLYLDNTSAHTVISGELAYYDPECIDRLSLNVAEVNANGDIIGITKLGQYPGPVSIFSLPLELQEPTGLLLNLSASYKRNITGNCWLTIRRLTVKTVDDSGVETMAHKGQSPDLFASQDEVSSDMQPSLSQNQVSSNKLTDLPLTTKTIRYLASDVDELFFVWGVDGWKVLPQAIRPNGTLIKNGVMHTPMTREGDSFLAKIQAPLGTTIDYGFLITKLSQKTESEPIWEADGAQDFHLIMAGDGVVEVQSKRSSTSEQSSATHLSKISLSLWISLGFALGLGILLVIRKNFVAADVMTSPFDRQFVYLRDLLHELVVRDIKLRYKRSILGIAWSLLNPLAQLLIFIFLFYKVLPLNIPNYPLFVFSGVLAWSWFQSSLFLATGAITDNRELIRRPGFPAAILPVVTVTSNLIHFLLALPILLLFVLFGGVQLTSASLALPLVIVLQFILTLSLAYLIATFHVTFRDTQHLLGVLLLLFFYLTPVFYDANLVPAPYQWFYQLNPMAHLIESYRSILMYGQLPEGLALLVLSLFAIGLLWFGYVIFTRASSRFVEEL